MCFSDSVGCGSAQNAGGFNHMQVIQGDLKRRVGDDGVKNK